MVSSGYPQVQYYISEASSQKQCLTQDTMYDVTADHQDSDNSSSSATIAVSCDTPMVFSTDDHPTDSTADQTEAKYASSSFSFSEATTSFAGPHTLFSDPPQQVEDIKYDVSQYLIWSQHQETFSAEPEKRGRGRPRKSASRVRPYDGRKKAHKPLMDQKLTVLLPLRRGSGKARGSGGRGRSRGRRGLSSGAHSPSQPSVPFNGGISAVLLGGAIRTRDSSGRRGGRRKVTTPLHRGRGFHNIKNMVNRKYSYKLPQDQGVRGRGGGKSWGRARRGEGRSRASGRRGSRASTTAKIRRHKAGSEVKVNKDEISLQPALEESFPEGKDESDTHFHFPMTEALTVARKGELWGHAPEQGRVRRRPGRPRKHPGPSGGITPTHTDQKKKGASQSAEVKEEPADEKVIQALVEHIRRESALLSRRPHRRRGSLRRGAGRQRRSSAPSEHVSPQAIFMPVDDTTEGSEDKLVVSGSLSSLEDITSTSHPGPSSAEASDGARQRGKVTGRRRFRGRIRTLAGRGRGRLGLSTSRGTALARSILKMARGGHGKRIAGSMTPGRLGGLETRKDEDEEGLMSTPGPVRGSGMRSLRAVGRRGGYTAVRSRGLRKTGLKRLMPTLDKEDLPGRGRYKAVRSRGLRGRGIHKLMPTLNKEEDKSDHVADEAKPLECSRCGKRYDYKACFIRHMQTCESSSCYQCILCDQTFFDLGHFKHHGQNEHGIEEDDVMMLEKKQ